MATARRPRISDMSGAFDLESRQKQKRLATEPQAFIDMAPEVGLEPTTP